MEMDKLNCKLVQDLLPNYIERMTTSETNIFIEKHLEECKECKKTAEIMKKETEFDAKGERRKIDYLKKYNRKMLVFKIIVGVVLALLVLGIAVKGYQWAIISKIYNHNTEYEIGKNYKIISRDAITGEITEKIFKDGVSYVKTSKGGIWENKDNKYMFIFDTKQYINLEKETLPEPLDEKVTIQTFGIFNVENKGDLLKTILTNNADIHEEEYRDLKCYVILINGEKIWIDKDSLFIIRDDYEGNSVEYFVKINETNEKDIEIPNLQEFTKAN